MNEYINIKTLKEDELWLITTNMWGITEAFDCTDAIQTGSVEIDGELIEVSFLSFINPYDIIIIEPCL